MQQNSKFFFGENRPCRLCEETRRFAFESMHGKYGDDAMSHPAVALDDLENFDTLSPTEQYDLSIRRICEEAPLRICDGELVSGAATLGQAIWGVVPAFRGGQAFIPSISHLTLGYRKALKMGVNGIEAELDRIIAQEGETAHRHSLKEAITSFRIWHNRYLEATEGVVHKNLQRVPFEVPTNFYEAVQSLWFLFAFTRLCGNWPGIGRIDEMLGAFLEKDLKSGVLTLEEAREILAHFFIKGCEWIQTEPIVGSGDAQHYQNIILGGVDEDGNEVTNVVTYLVLDVIEELGISDFPITIRVNEKTPKELLRRAAEVVRLGGGVLAFYNEDLILESLVRDGYDLREARNFTNDGCWEIQIGGKTNFAYHPFDSLRLLLDKTLGLQEETPNDYPDMQSLYEDYKKQMNEQMELIFKEKITDMLAEDDNGRYESWKTTFPTSVIDLFTEGCAESGKRYLEGGPKYQICSPHIGGLADTVNSLYAIEQLVFVEKKMTLRELCEILKNNWEGQENLRLSVKNHYTYYGNNSEGADRYYVQVLNDFADGCERINARLPERLHFVGGVSTFGRQIEWSPFRAATPFGAKKGEVLSGNAGPTPATDLNGVTALVQSYCKGPNVRLTSGTALDVALHPTSLKNENGITSLVSLIEGFCRLGGFFLQPDSITVETLRAAQNNPKDYKTLSVRISGWNARFVTLNREWQEMVIEKNGGNRNA